MSIPVTFRDDDLNMIVSKQTLAIAVTGLASLTWIGVSGALEGSEPTLDPEVEVVEPDTTCTTDDATDSAVEGTEDEATDDTATDEAVEGTEDEAVEDEGDDCDEDATDVEDLEVEDEVDVEAVDGAERPENHGFYVSEAARGECRELEGAERGACVSEVAKSDLGKPEHAGPKADEPEVEDEPADEDEVEGTTTEADATSGPGKGQGNGRGHGKG